MAWSQIVSYLEAEAHRALGRYRQTRSRQARRLVRELLRDLREARRGLGQGGEL